MPRTTTVGGGMLMRLKQRSHWCDDADRDFRSGRLRPVTATVMSTWFGPGSGKAWSCTRATGWPIVVISSAFCVLAMAGFRGLFYYVTSWNDGQGTIILPMYMPIYVHIYIPPRLPRIKLKLQLNMLWPPDNFWLRCSGPPAAYY